MFKVLLLKNPKFYTTVPLYNKYNNIAADASSKYSYK